MLNSKILDKAKETILLQANAIHTLHGLLTKDFEDAVSAIHNASGRLVVSGIGKSAIVAQKIVATMNSTGTPALFMHAADAIHGDLGMIQKNDVVLLISKSGDSPEVKVLIPIIKNFGNPIIALVGNIESYLASNATYVINSTVSVEACTNNLAPTTSTTAQMVLGDALAICLMELNGFTGKDFAKFHPGGNLGKRLYLKVEDLYKNNAAPKVYKTTSLKNVIIEITTNRLGVAAVLDEGNNVIGIITDGDLRRMLENDVAIDKILAEDIYTKNPKFIDASSLAIHALELFRKEDISQLLVMDNSNYVGVLHLHDLVREGII